MTSGVDRVEVFDYIVRRNWDRKSSETGTVSNVKATPSQSRTLTWLPLREAAQDTAGSSHGRIRACVQHSYPRGKKSGGGEHRSPYLFNANEPLYHLSYTPIT